MSAAPQEKKPAPAVSLPADIPAEVRPYLQEMGYLDADRLQVGDHVAPLALTALRNGEQVTIGASDAAQPTVLIFGSYT